MIDKELIALSGIIEDAPYELLKSDTSENYLSNCKLQFACNSCTCDSDCASKSKKIYLNNML